jgi:hypothetical protein
MKEFDNLLAVASWEDRFFEGIQCTLESTSVHAACILFSREFNRETAAVRNRLLEVLNQQKIESTECEFEFCAADKTWHQISAYVRKTIQPRSRVLFDISTSPREIIWFVLHHLQKLQCSVSFIYYPPEKYGNWLSRDADEPRLIFHRSGVAFPDRKTAIFAVTGFDADRVAQLVNRYEPAKLILAVQSGDSFDTMQRNASIHRQHFENNPSVDFFEIDAYGDFNRMYKALEAQLVPLLEDYNILATSLGPKPSAVALFLLSQNYPDVGLVYTPSQEYALDYSKGTKAKARVSFSVL